MQNVFLSTTDNNKITIIPITKNAFLILPKSAKWNKETDIDIDT